MSVRLFVESGKEKTIPVTKDVQFVAIMGCALCVTGPLCHRVSVS